MPTCEPRDCTSFLCELDEFCAMDNDTPVCYSGMSDIIQVNIHYLGIHYLGIHYLGIHYLGIQYLGIHYLGEYL